jgi:predicted glutamine amidotransferase
MLSATPASPEWGLLSAPRSLLAQSRANRSRRQGDGWGLGWYRDRHAQWIVSPRPLYEEEKNARRIAERFLAKIAVAHVRDASNPLRRMCWRQESGRLWVASEPLDDGAGWRPLEPGRWLTASIQKGRVRIREGRLT